MDLFETVRKVTQREKERSHAIRPLTTVNKRRSRVSPEFTYDSTSIHTHKRQDDRHQRGHFSHGYYTSNTTVF